MSTELRTHILLLLDEHSKTGSDDFKMDRDLATTTGRPVQEIQRQLDILGSQRLVLLAKAQGPTYGARIQPEGSLLIEQIKGSTVAPKTPIGF